MRDYEKQANDFLVETGTKFKTTYVKTAPYFDGDKEDRDIYRITLKCNGRSMSFLFGQSIHDSVRSIVPTPYDVLSTLEKYDPGAFKDFCDDYGYNFDSRKAEKIYRKVKTQYEKLCKLYNEKELEKLREIQ